jgi:hypothetical protein
MEDEMAVNRYTRGGEGGGGSDVPVDSAVTALNNAVYAATAFNSFAFQLEAIRFQVGLLFTLRMEALRVAFETAKTQIDIARVQSEQQISEAKQDAITEILTAKHEALDEIRAASGTTGTADSPSITRHPAWERTEY